jgi:F-type H+-transporting ATPase subunit delta
MAALASRGLRIRPLVRQGAVFASVPSMAPSFAYGSFQSARVRRISTAPISLAQAESSSSSSPTQPLFAVPTLEESKEVLSKLEERLEGKNGKFARYLLVNAVANNVVEKIKEDAQWLLNSLKNYEVKSALRDRSLDRVALYKDLQTQGGLHQLTIEFVDYVFRQKKIAELSLILSAFLESTKTYLNEVDVVVTIAGTPQNPKELDLLVDILKISYLKPDVKASVSTVIDPSIIGGFIVQAGDVFIDNSVKTDIEARDRKVEEWLPTIKSWDDLQTKGNVVSPRVQAKAVWIEKLKEVVEDKRKEKASDLSFFEEKLKHEEAVFKQLQDQPHLSDSLAHLLHLHKRQAAEKDTATQNQIQKEIDALVRDIVVRVKDDPG